MNTHLFHRGFITIALSFLLLFPALSANLDSLRQKADKYLLSNPKESNFILELIIKDFHSLNDSLFKAETFYLYGLSSNLLGSFDESIDAFYEVLKYSPNPESRLNIQSHLQISGTYCTLEDYKKAIEFNDYSLAYSKVVKDSLLIAACFNNRGLIHYNLEEFDIADNLFLQALHLNRKMSNIKGVATNLNNMALYKGNTQVKLSYIDEAIIINKNLNAKWSICENYNNKGKQLYYGEYYEESLSILLQARELIKNIGAKELECDNYEYLSWVYAALNKYKEAYSNLTLYSTLSHELQKDQKLRSVERSINNKKINEKEYSIQMINKQLEINTLQNNIFVLLTVLAVFTFVMIFVPLWYKKKKALELSRAKLLLEKSERDLIELKVAQQHETISTIESNIQILNQDLTSYALFIQNRNEVLSAIQEKLKATSRLSVDKLKLEIKSIELFIKNYRTSSTPDDCLLVTKVETMNKKFIDRLKAKYPTLTNGEVRLAILLRVGLSTKDIAVLLGVNVASVNVNRHRLRKSLCLNKEKDLLDFLTTV